MTAFTGFTILLLSSDLLVFFRKQAVNYLLRLVVGAFTNVHPSNSSVHV
jgi:hypothetical protein